LFYNTEQEVVGVFWNRGPDYAVDGAFANYDMGEDFTEGQAAS